MSFKTYARIAAVILAILAWVGMGFGSFLVVGIVGLLAVQAVFSGNRIWAVVGLLAVGWMFWHYTLPVYYGVSARFTSGEAAAVVDQVKEQVQPVLPGEPAAPAAAPQGAAPVQPVVPTGPKCITSAQLNNMRADSNEVTKLINALNQMWDSGKIEQYKSTLGGGWDASMAENKVVVPANSVFWTDMYKNPNSSAVTAILTEGWWGTFANTTTFTIPSGSAGGRWAHLCEETTATLQSFMAFKPTTGCIGEKDLNNIISAVDPVAAYNKFYEQYGYAYGSPIEPGDTVELGVLLGTFPANAIPSGMVDLAPNSSAPGHVWDVNSTVNAPNGGRWMPVCK